MSAFLLASWPSLLGVVLLLVINALLVLAELAVIKLKYSHFNPDLRDRLNEHPRLSRLLEHGGKTVKVARFGMTLCILGYGILLFPVFVELMHMAGLEGAPWAILEILAVLIAFFGSACLHYLVAENIPRGLALRYPIGALTAASIPLRVMGWIEAPMLRLMQPIGSVVLRTFKAEAADDIETLDMEAQIELLGENAPTMSEVAQSILRNALLLRELEVSDVLLPRSQVQFFDVFDSNPENLEVARRTGHTRFPLCEGELDKCVGLIHIKDIFRSGGDPERLDFRKIRRPIHRVSGDMPLEEALRQLLGRKSHMSIVTDDFGGTLGVLTLERILEQLVGDIQDEFDAEEALIQEVDENAFEVSGLTPVHEIEQKLDVEIENEEVSTLGGLITAELGRIPEADEELTLDGLVVTVTEVDERRVISARVARLDPEDESDEEASSS